MIYTGGMGGAGIPDNRGVGGRGASSIITTNAANAPSMPDLTVRRSGTLNLTTNQFTEDPMTQDIDYDAQEIAVDALREKKTGSIRDKVLAAVEEFGSLFNEQTPDGTVFSFVRQIDDRDYHYAAIRSGGRWFSTGAKTALTNGTDDELITWLVGLGIYEESNFLAYARAKNTQIEIEATATES